jgi:hypothetical protein
MSGKLANVFNYGGTDSESRKEPIDMTFLSIEFVFVGVTTLLVMSLVLFFTMALLRYQ